MSYPHIKAQPWAWINNNLTFPYTRFKIWNSRIMDYMPIWVHALLRPYFHYVWRKTVRDLQPGMFMIGCGSVMYEPAIVLNYGFDDVEYWNLCSQNIGSCSLWHCAPEPIDEERAMTLVEGWKKEGPKGLTKVYCSWTEEQYQQWKLDWKNWKEGDPYPISPEPSF